MPRTTAPEASVALHVPGGMDQELSVIGDYSFKNTQPFGPRYGCVGDASAFLDPVFSSGVAFAMDSAHALVELLADAGDWRRAWGVARDRRSRGERPPAQTAMARVVRAAEAAGCWREALALMDDMRRDDAVFYPNPLLDAAFKPGIMVWSALAGADLGPDDDDDLRMPPEKGDWGYKGPI